jgi:hypothetical protein
MRGVWRAGSRRLINRLQSHQAHQAADPVTADTNTLPPQLAHHLPAAVEGVFEKQLVDATHQCQVLRAISHGRVIERGSADRQKFALMAHAQVGMAYGQKVETAERMEAVARLPKRLSFETAQMGGASPAA